MQEDIVAEHFLDDELVLIVPPEHPLTKNKKISVFELSKYPFISREKGSGTRHIMENALKKVGFDPLNLNIIMELGSTTAIKAAVSSGLGISIVSKWTVKEMAKQNELVTLTLNETKFEREFILIYLEKKFKTKAVYEYLNFLRSDEVQKIILS